MEISQHQNTLIEALKNSNTAVPSDGRDPPVASLTAFQAILTSLSEKVDARPDLAALQRELSTLATTLSGFPGAGGPRTNLQTMQEALQTVTEAIGSKKVSQEELESFVALVRSELASDDMKALLSSAAQAAAVTTMTPTRLLKKRNLPASTSHPGSEIMGPPQKLRAFERPASRSERPGTAGSTGSSVSQGSGGTFGGLFGPHTNQPADEDEDEEEDVWEIEFDDPGLQAMLVRVRTQVYAEGQRNGRTEAIKARVEGRRGSPPLEDDPEDIEEMERSRQAAAAQFEEIRKRREMEAQNAATEKAAAQQAAAAKSGAEETAARGTAAEKAAAEKAKTLPLESRATDSQIPVDPATPTPRTTSTILAGRGKLRLTGKPQSLRKKGSLTGLASTAARALRNKTSKETLATPIKTAKATKAAPIPFVQEHSDLVAWRKRLTWQEVSDMFQTPQMRRTDASVIEDRSLSFETPGALATHLDQLAFGPKDQSSKSASFTYPGGCLLSNGIGQNQQVTRKSECHFHRNGNNAGKPCIEIRFEAGVQKPYAMGTGENVAKAVVPVDRFDTASQSINGVRWIAIFRD